MFHLRLCSTLGANIASKGRPNMKPQTCVHGPAVEEHLSIIFMYQVPGTDT